MPRIRTIKPDFWTDEKIGLLKRDARLLFIGLFNLADDDGIVKSNPAYIKGQLFSYDDELRIGSLKEWLGSLEEARMLIPFTYNREGYYIIRTFRSHQTINRPSPSRIPANIIENLLDGIFKDDSMSENDLSLNTHGVITEHSRLEGKGKEIEKERKCVKVLDYVSLTLDETQKLIVEFNEDGYAWIIEKLNSYKGSKGKKYKNDYLAIKQWVVKAYQEEKEKSCAKKEKISPRDAMQNSIQKVYGIVN